MSDNNNVGPFALLERSSNLNTLKEGAITTALNTTIGNTQAVGNTHFSIRTPVPNYSPITGNTKVTENTNVTGNTQINNNTKVVHNVESDNYDYFKKFEIPTIDSKFLADVYHASHLYVLYLFIILYLVIYFFLAFFLKKNGTENIDLLLKRLFDYSMLLIIIFYLLYYYSTSSIETKENVLSVFWNWCIDWMRDPMNLYGIVFFSVVFYIWVFFMHINLKYEHTPYLIKLLEHKLWIIIVWFAIFFIIYYFLNIDIYSFLFGNEIVTGIFGKFSDEKLNSKGLIEYKQTTTTPTDKIVGNNVTSKNNTVTYEQVFNIGNNLYSYEDAQHVCTAYGARLANYDEIEDAYNHGAEWCNYGWSDGQMAFFPTQKSTWDGLQKDPKNKNKCGRPGINGGYMDNKFLRFGVNCFGKKPAPKPSDLAMMNQPLPKTAEQAVIDQKVEFWKKNADALLKVNSFNRNQWSEY
jgi:hypothetical protein